jgi:hypothetical protein
MSLDISIVEQDQARSFTEEGLSQNDFYEVIRGSPLFLNYAAAHI